MLVPNEDPLAGIAGMPGGVMITLAPAGLAEVADEAVPTPSKAGNCAAILAPKSGM